MEPLILLIEPELDERAAAATMSRAQKVYEEGARDISRVMRTQLNDGTQAAGKGFEELETKARRAYLGMQDAAEKVAAAERKHEAAKEKGAANAEAVGRRVERARLDEIQAIERATTAYREYETAAHGAGQAGENAGRSILGGLRDSVSGAGQSGGDMANEFVGGFAGSSALMRLGAAGGPIGLALVGVAAIGVTAGKVLADNIAAGLQSMQMQDLYQARLGVDDATMASYGSSAAKAYTDMWGASVEDNLRAVQFGVQAGVIAPGASDAEVERTIAQMHTLAGVMEVDVQEAARAAGQLMRGGFAADGEQAANIIATGFQNGLDISGDWLDTITEYSTQFRKLGLDGGDAIGLISQGLEGGARDSDKVADSLKEFSIRAVDGSKSTAEGFAAIGLNADDMAARFLAGGDSARTAFGSTLQAIKGLDDPIQQAMTWQALFGTQWEDMGDAINSMDLSKARSEFAGTEGAIDRMTAKLSEHANGWDGLGRQIDVTFGKLQKWLADSAIGEFFSQGVPDFIGDSLFPTQRSDAEAALAAAQQAEAERRAMGSGFLNAGEAQRARRGTATGADGPVPGDRTPILTETQRAAQEAAAGGSGLPSAPSLPLQYTSTAGLPTQVANAQSRLDESAHEAAEKEARLNQLRQTNIATADDIQKAENDLTKAQQNRLQAEQSLNDARVSATEKQTKQLAGMSSELGEFGAQLDKDFGISKGLGGIVDNFVRAAGNILAAPFLQALGMIEKANPNEGSGMVGMLAAGGSFGSQFTPAALAAAQGTAGYGSGMPGSGASYGTPGAAQPGESARDFAHRSMMPFWQNQGLTVGDHQADKYGEHQNGALDIMVDSIAEGNAVLQQVLADPNVNGAIFNNQVYGYGQGSTPRPYSGGNTGDPNQDHTNHVHALYKPGGGNNIAASGGGGGFSIPSVAPSYAPSAGPGVGAGPGWFPPGQTTLAGVNGGGGQSPVFGANPAVPAGPGIGGAFGMPMPAAPTAGAAAGLGGQAYPAGPGGGGLGMGGGLMDAAMGAAGAADLMMPGAGAAAKIGIQLANRTIKYAGQMAGIGVSGALQTLTPAGDNPKASIGNSWFGKLAGGLASAAPALPNQAGGKPPGALAGQQGDQQGQGGAAGNTQNITLNQTNNRMSEDAATGSGVREMAAANFNNPGKQ